MAQTRRNFMKIGAAVMGVSMLDISRALAGVSVSNVQDPPVLAIYDPAFSESALFRDELQQLPMQMMSSSELASRGQQLLQITKSNQIRRIIGLTAQSDLFLVQQLLPTGRMIIQAEHDSRGSGALRHRIEGQPNDQRVLQHLAALGAEWPRGVHGLLTANLRASPTLSNSTSLHQPVFEAESAGFVPPVRGFLVSWAMLI